MWDLMPIRIKSSFQVAVPCLHLNRESRELPDIHQRVPLFHLTDLCIHLIENKTDQLCAIQKHYLLRDPGQPCLHGYLGIL